MKRNKQLRLFEDTPRAPGRTRGPITARKAPPPAASRRAVEVQHERPNTDTSSIPTPRACQTQAGREARQRLSALAACIRERHQPRSPGRDEPTPAEGLASATS